MVLSFNLSRSISLPNDEKVLNDMITPSTATCVPNRRNRGGGGGCSKRPLRTTKSLDLNIFKLSSNNEDNGNNSRDQRDTGDHVFYESMKELSFSQDDVLSMVVQEEDSFQNLKKSLRKRGVVTNSFLKENMHFYIQHCKFVQQAKQQRQNELQTRVMRKAATDAMLERNIAANAAA